jgi:uncharacterized protein (UPF0264 family)
MTTIGRATPGLLVSVRSATEARAALDGGADLIDVKEPSRGPLGAADRNVIEQVVLAVGGQVPVSAALGEWADYSERAIPSGVSYVKWGLARISACGTEDIGRLRHAAPGVAPVLVAYADHRRAGSPDPQALVHAACEFRFPALLIDTAVKDDSTLSDWLTLDMLMRIRCRLDDFGVRLALAGSLDARAIRALSPLAPDWFAVRGSACVGGRAGTVSVERVRQLRTIIHAKRVRADAG